MREIFLSQPNYFIKRSLLLVSLAIQDCVCHGQRVFKNTCYKKAYCLPGFIVLLTLFLSSSFKIKVI